MAYFEELNIPVNFPLPNKWGELTPDLRAKYKQSKFMVDYMEGKLKSASDALDIISFQATRDNALANIRMIEQSDFATEAFEYYKEKVEEEFEIDHEEGMDTELSDNIENKRLREESPDSSPVSHRKISRIRETDTSESHNGATQGRNGAKKSAQQNSQSGCSPGSFK